MPNEVYFIIDMGNLIGNYPDSPPIIVLIAAAYALMCDLGTSLLVSYVPCYFIVITEIRPYSIYTNPWKVMQGAS